VPKRDNGQRRRLPDKIRLEEQQVTLQPYFSCVKQPASWCDVLLVRLARCLVYQYLRLICLPFAPIVHGNCTCGVEASELPAVKYKTVGSFAALISRLYCCWAPHQQVQQDERSTIVAGRRFSDTFLQYYGYRDF
jgi:hypothetical protein